MQGFRDVINECGFLDLGFRGLPFTWCNNRRGSATTWLKLDRFMATNDWVMRFNSVVVDHMESTASDHKPLCLNLHPMTTPRPRHWLFRFEDMWRMDPGCEPAVTKAWVPKTWGSPIAQVGIKIQRCSEELRQWSRVQFGNITKILKEKTEKLKQAEMESSLGHGHDEVLSIRHEVNELLLKKEKMWRQRSRDSWLKEGDRNTKYFHSRASHRRRRNSILSMRTEAGEYVQDPKLIGAQFIEYYQTLFTAAPLEDVASVLDGVQRCVTEEMNQELTCPFTEKGGDFNYEADGSPEGTWARWYAANFFPKLLACGGQRYNNSCPILLTFRYTSTISKSHLCYSNPKNKKPRESDGI